MIEIKQVCEYQWPTDFWMSSLPPPPGIRCKLANYGVCCLETEDVGRTKLPKEGCELLKRVASRRPDYSFPWRTYNQILNLDPIVIKLARP